MAFKAELIELAHDAIIVRDCDGRIMLWNRGAEEMYGWLKSDAEGQTTHTFLQTEFPRPLSEIEAELMRSGNWVGILTHTRRDGRRIMVASQWTMKADDGRQPTNILEINRDVTEQLLAEEKFRGLLEFAPDAMILVNEAGQIILANTQTEKLFGYQREELIGQQVEVLVPERFRANHPAHRKEYFREPRSSIDGRRAGIIRPAQGWQHVSRRD